MNTKLTIAATLTVAATLAGCSGGATPPAGQPAVSLKAVTAPDGTELKQVALVDLAVERLGITTGTVQLAEATVDGVAGRHKVLPYAAVVYDSKGLPWAYVTTAPRTYLRARLTIAAIQGDTAVLTDGPAVGTAVVTQGAAELLGAEAEIAGEE